MKKKKNYFRYSVLVFLQGGGNWLVVVSNKYPCLVQVQFLIVLFTRGVTRASHFTFLCLSFFIRKKVLCWGLNQLIGVKCLDHWCTLSRNHINACRCWWAAAVLGAVVVVVRGERQTPEWVRESWGASVSWFKFVSKISCKFVLPRAQSFKLSWDSVSQNIPFSSNLVDYSFSHLQQEWNN